MTENLSARAARTRAALLNAGVALLAQRPVDAIAIDELVSAAGVAKGSFFNHFADKAQFAKSVAREVRMDVEGRVTEINHDVADPLDRLAGGMIASAVYAMQQHERTRVLVGAYRGLSVRDHPVNAGLLHDLQAAVARKLIRLPSEQAGLLFWLGCCQVLMGSILQAREGEMKPVDLLPAMLEMGLRGLGAEDDAIARVTDPDRIAKRAAGSAQSPARTD